MRVVLASHEMMFAAHVGVSRHVASLGSGLRDRHGFNGDGWGVHIEGAAGEMAVAKFLGRYWDGSCNTFKRGGDVGDVQVRTRSSHDYELIVRPDDRDSDYFVLVTGRSPEFVLRGWILGADAKQPKWLQTHGSRPPAFFVPQPDLHQFSSARLTTSGEGSTFRR